MADQTEFLELARELIAEDGRPITFGKIDPGTVDADKPWKGPTRDAGDPPPLVDPVTCLAVFLPVGGGFGRMVSDESLFKDCSQMLLVAPPETGEDLEQYHVFTEEGGTERFHIHVTDTLKPADLALLFAMGVKR